MVEYLVSPHLTFHGTSNEYVPSIFRNGFLKPGAKNSETREEHAVHCGSTYGRGIYSSPSAVFSLMYSGSSAQPTKPNGFWGLKLIVCATIMGRTREMDRKDNWREQSDSYEGADSHVGNRGQEDIVFSTEAILLVYVINLDWASENVVHFKEVPDDATKWKLHPPKNGRFNTDTERLIRRTKMTPKAAKHFPFEFGNMRPAGLFVEDMAETDDDEEEEEEYGDYQKDRLDAVYSGEKTDIWAWDGDLWDEDSSSNEYADSIKQKKDYRVGIS